MHTQVFTYQQEFELESGEILPEFQLEYQTAGKINEDGSNIIWACHALTGNADVMDWWSGLFGDNKIFNPDEHFIICANVLGSCYGSTGPLSVNPRTNKPYYHSFPSITIRDMVNALDLLRVDLGISKIHTLIGGSLGGQQALEWAVKHPTLAENLIIVASNAKHSPWGIAFNETQRIAINADPTWKEERDDAGINGLIAARSIAMLSYRNYETYETTQMDDDEDKVNNFRASSYQQYQGEKLTKRFNAYSYWTLSKAMDSHNLGRNRGGLKEALKLIKSYTQVIGVNTDVLFPVSEQRFIARYVENVTYEEINSTYGHDGFLVEFNKLAKAIDAFFKQKNRKKLIYDTGC
ncbi:homoserine O-acetyltransferase MetX [Sediminitomix flava]|uniref:Homoserine O-acetyltransferase n=1 Tax=Sediminitomix flava TaxID=379075 RepID=A0A315ZAX9_SEDFL|nr:homoserine O-acetyltransferase [Sediminitomix flava]PWJ42510.1 homoserine O-acetyltransferase [Sediminitomix flava]